MRNAAYMRAKRVRKLGEGAIAGGKSRLTNYVSQTRFPDPSIRMVTDLATNFAFEQRLLPTSICGASAPLPSPCSRRNVTKQAPGSQWELALPSWLVL